jgi:hypothetical protein
MWRLIAPRVRRYAWRRGVAEGRHAWFTVWIVVGAAQVIRRLTVAKPVVERMELRQGETIVISDLGRLDET